VEDCIPRSKRTNKKRTASSNKKQKASKSVAPRLQGVGPITSRTITGPNSLPAVPKKSPALPMTRERTYKFKAPLPKPPPVTCSAGVQIFDAYLGRQPCWQYLKNSYAYNHPLINAIEFTSEDPRGCAVYFKNKKDKELFTGNHAERRSILRNSYLAKGKELPNKEPPNFEVKELIKMGLSRPKTMEWDPNISRKALEAVEEYDTQKPNVYGDIKEKARAKEGEKVLKRGDVKKGFRNKLNSKALNMSDSKRNDSRERRKREREKGNRKRKNDVPTMNSIGWSESMQKAIHQILTGQGPLPPGMLRRKYKTAQLICEKAGVECDLPEPRKFEAQFDFAFQPRETEFYSDIFLFIADMYNLFASASGSWTHFLLNSTSVTLRYGHYLKPFGDKILGDLYNLFKRATSREEEAPAFEAQSDEPQPEPGWFQRIVDFLSETFTGLLGFTEKLGDLPRETLNWTLNLEKTLTNLERLGSFFARMIQRVLSCIYWVMGWEFRSGSVVDVANFYGEVLDQKPEDITTVEKARAYTNTYMAYTHYMRSMQKDPDYSAIAKRWKTYSITHAYCVKLISQETLKRGITVVELAKLLDEIAALQGVTNFDYKTAKALKDHWPTLNLYRSLISVENTQPNLIASLQIAINWYRDKWSALHAATRSAAQRLAPIGICLWGDAGTGKSTAAEVLKTAIGRKLYPNLKDNYCYAHNVSDSYEEGYYGQPMVSVSDAGAVADDQLVKETTGYIMGVLDIDVRTAVKAALNEKSNVTYENCEWLIMTSMHTPAANTFWKTSPKAFERRFNYILKFSGNSGHANSGGQISIDWWKEHNVKIEVSVDGAGYSESTIPEILKMIFERYQSRVENNVDNVVEDILNNLGTIEGQMFTEGDSSTPRIEELDSQGNIVPVPEPKGKGRDNTREDSDGASSSGTVPELGVWLAGKFYPCKNGLPRSVKNPVVSQYKTFNKAALEVCCELGYVPLDVYYTFLNQNLIIWPGHVVGITSVCGGEMWYDGTKWHKRVRPNTWHRSMKLVFNAFIDLFSVDVYFSLIMSTLFIYWYGWLVGGTLLGAQFLACIYRIWLVTDRLKHKTEALLLWMAGIGAISGTVLVTSKLFTWATKNEIEDQAKYSTSGKLKAVVKKPNSVLKQAEVLEAQVSDDDIMSIRRNCVEVEIGGAQVWKSNGIFVCNNWLLMTKHMIWIAQNDPSRPLRFRRKDHIWTTVVKYTVYDSDDEAVLVKIEDNIAPFKDIRHRFLTREDVNAGLWARAPGRFVSSTRDAIAENIRPLDRSSISVQDGSNVYSAEYFEGTVHADAVTSKGDCGSVLLVLGRGSGVIMGLHYGFSHSLQRSAYTIVTYERLSLLTPPEPSNLGSKSSSFEPQVCDPHCANGLVRLYYVPSKHEPLARTNYYISPIANELFNLKGEKIPIASSPARGDTYEYQGKTIGPDTKWSEGMESRVPVYYPEEWHEEYAQGIVEQLPGPQECMKERWSREEAINGFPAYGIKPVEMATSAGSPLKFLRRAKGKHGWAFRDSQDLLRFRSVLIAKFAEQDLALDDEDLSRLEWFFCRNYKMDETREVIVQTGNGDKPEHYVNKLTRTLCASNLTMFLLIRTYLGSFVYAVRQYKNFGGGVDAGGPEFDSQFRSLIKDKRFLEFGDASKFDTSFPTMMFGLFETIAQKWYALHYPEGEFTHKRAALFRADRNALIHDDNYLCHMDGIFPTGHPMTYEWNSIRTDFMCWAYYTHGLGRRPYLYWRNINNWIVGDDFMFASSEDDVRLTTYAVFVLKYFGIKITDAKKRSELVDHHDFTEGEIVKRTPFFNGHYWVGLLDPKAIFGQLQWLSNNAGTPEHACMANMNSALREFGLYGKTTFDHYRQLFVKLSMKRFWKVDLITWSEFLDCFASRKAPM